MLLFRRSVCSRRPTEHGAERSVSAPFCPGVRFNQWMRSKTNCKFNSFRQSLNEIFLLLPSNKPVQCPLLLLFTSQIYFHTPFVSLIHWFVRAYKFVARIEYSSIWGSEGEVSIRIKRITQTMQLNCTYGSGERKEAVNKIKTFVFHCDSFVWRITLWTIEKSDGWPGWNEEKEESERKRTKTNQLLLDRGWMYWMKYATVIKEKKGIQTSDEFP